MKTHFTRLSRPARLGLLAVTLALLALVARLFEPSSHPQAPARVSQATPPAAPAVAAGGAATIRLAAPETFPPPEQAANLPTNLRMHRLTEEAPAWAVGFGKEFWRRPVAAPAVQAKAGDTNAPLPASLNLGDVIERVHHALGTNAAGTRPEVKARAYTAAFDGEGLRFSPHRPGEDSSEPTAGNAVETAATPFPLTPALSPSAGAREERNPSLDPSMRADSHDARGAALSLPLGGGEGRGEGERNSRPPVPIADPATEARFRTVSVHRNGAALFPVTHHASRITPPWGGLGGRPRGESLFPGSQADRKGVFLVATPRNGQGQVHP